MRTRGDSSHGMERRSRRSRRRRACCGRGPYGGRCCPTRWIAKHSGCHGQRSAQKAVSRPRPIDRPMRRLSHPGGHSPRRSSWRSTSTEPAMPSESIRSDGSGQAAPTAHGTQVASATKLGSTPVTQIQSGACSGCAAAAPHRQRQAPKRRSDTRASLSPRAALLSLAAASRHSPACGPFSGVLFGRPHLQTWWATRA